MYNRPRREAGREISPTIAPAFFLETFLGHRAGGGAKLEFGRQISEFGDVGSGAEAGCASWRDENFRKNLQRSA